MVRFHERGLMLLAVVGIICVLISPSRSLAQDATLAATPVALPNPLAQLVAAIAAGDAAAIAAMFTADGTYEDVPNAVTAHGRAEIAAFFTSAAAVNTDVVIRPLAIHVGDGFMVLEYDFAATDAASGERREWRGAMIIELDGELIRRSADYYEPATEAWGRS